MKYSIRSIQEISFEDDDVQKLLKAISQGVGAECMNQIYRRKLDRIFHLCCTEKVMFSYYYLVF